MFFVGDLPVDKPNPFGLLVVKIYPCGVLCKYIAVMVLLVTLVFFFENGAVRILRVCSLCGCSEYYIWK